MEKVRYPQVGAILLCSADAGRAHKRKYLGIWTSLKSISNQSKPDSITSGYLEGEADLVSCS